MEKIETIEKQKINPVNTPSSYYFPKNFHLTFKANPYTMVFPMLYGDL